MPRYDRFEVLSLVGGVVASFVLQIVVFVLFQVFPDPGGVLLAVVVLMWIASLGIVHELAKGLFGPQSNKILDWVLPLIVAAPVWGVMAFSASYLVIVAEELIG